MNEFSVSYQMNTKYYKYSIKNNNNIKVTAMQDDIQSPALPRIEFWVAFFSDKAHSVFHASKDGKRVSLATAGN